MPSARRPERVLARRGGWVEALAIPAALFGVVARLRGWLYDRRWLPVRAVDAPVVCVGNLTAGGTGKTPTVAWVVERLRAAGRVPGVLSRGYRRGATDGDEKRELAARLGDVLHVEDPDRVRGAAQLVDQGVDVIVLDDGFQHRRLHRDLDLVLVDATRPWGLPALDGGEPLRAFLPRGLLREAPGALRRAQAILVTRSDGVAWEDLTRLEAELQRHAPGVPLARAVHAPTAVVTRDPATGDELRRDPATLRGLEVDLVTGVGNPDAVRATLEEQGARVIEHRTFPDHHPFEPGDLAGLGARPVVTTAKDRVRMGDDLLLGLELWVLEVALEVTRGGEDLDALLAALPEAPARAARRNLHAGLHG